jgi:hypothetical protein
MNSPLLVTHRSFVNMPYTSERQLLLSDLTKLISFAAMDDNEEEEEEAALLYCLVAESRYLSGGERRYRSNHFFLQSFSLMAETEFRQLFRTSRQGFLAVLEQIETHPVFTNSSTCSQTAPAWQLAVALCRLGSNGTGASVGKMQAIFGIGMGTVGLFTNRVITALLAVKRRWVAWPDAERRSEIGRVMKQEGFPGCVGFIDGTTIPLSQKPKIDGEVYFDRKKRYVFK